MAAVALPGYWLSIALVDRIGRRVIQIIGFVMLIVIFLVLGIAYHGIVEYRAVFLIIYGATFFFSNFGANTSTYSSWLPPFALQLTAFCRYIIPGEAFPASIRSTCHGISAASGKIGAVIVRSSFLFNFSKTNADNLGSRGVPLP